MNKAKGKGLDKSRYYRKCCRLAKSLKLEECGQSSTLQPVAQPLSISLCIHSLEFQRSNGFKEALFEQSERSHKSFASEFVFENQ